jgi:Family of unknown function (DUF6893)
MRESRAAYFIPFKVADIRLTQETHAPKGSPVINGHCTNRSAKSHACPMLYLSDVSDHWPGDRFIKKIIADAALVLTAVAVAKNIPDLVRYLKMSMM